MSTTLQQQVSTWAKFVQFLLLPATCIACRKPAGRPIDLCLACAASFVVPDRPCVGCALTMPPGSLALLCGSCLKTRHIAHTVAAFAYLPPVSALISQFKYQGKLQHGRVLTSLLAAKISAGVDTWPLPDLLLPVPLHTMRLRERGFNQALVMALQLGKLLDIPVQPALLQRVLQTPQQQGLGARERKRNLRRAFRLAPEHHLQSCRSIALVDDVVTTMSTVSELARLLHRQVGHDLIIQVWCLARA